MTERTLIVGAGMTGLACARRLSEAGHAPLVLDKGRGIGGRLATRRAGQGLQFDHGAQHVTAGTPEFAACLGAMQTAGAAALWDDGSGRAHMVGVPGMSALARHLAGAVEIRQSAEVSAIRQGDAGWEVVLADRTLHARRVVVTVPAPQAAALIGHDTALAGRLADVAIAPCLTLMAEQTSDRPAPFRSRRDPDDDLAWIACDSSKPGRPERLCWVAQAGIAWSVRHLDLGKDEIAAKMLPMLCDRIGIPPDSIGHRAGHRWRYANVTRPLGQPFLRDAPGSLYLGGDWCLGARVEAAWTSGTAIADDILASA